MFWLLWKTSVWPYKSPFLPLNIIIACESRDSHVTLINNSNAKIPLTINWLPRMVAKSLILFGDRTEVVKQETFLVVASGFRPVGFFTMVFRSTVGV